MSADEHAPRGFAKRACAFALLTPVLAACGPAPAAPPGKERPPAESVVLVRKLQPDQAGNAAAGVGVLTLKDGCLFMAHRDGSRTLLLWPAGTRLDRDADGALMVLPGGPGHAVRVGEEITVGGSTLWKGEGDSALVGPGRPVQADAAFPEGCTGAVWNIYTVEPGPPAELPVPDGAWSAVQGRGSAYARWPAGEDEPRFAVRCRAGATTVDLTASVPDRVHPRPPELRPVPTQLSRMEISARQGWARYPVHAARPGFLAARAPEGDPFLDRLVNDGFTVRTDRGVTMVPPGGEALRSVLAVCRAP